LNCPFYFLTWALLIEVLLSLSVGAISSVRVFY
jgi:hypothetical protein